VARDDRLIFLKKLLFGRNRVSFGQFVTPWEIFRLGQRSTFVLAPRKSFPAMYKVRN